MSDLEGRASDYERRLAGAGTTDDLMGGLAESVKRTERTSRLLAVGLVIVVIFIVAVGTLAVVARQNANRSVANADKIAGIVLAQQRDRYDGCKADVKVVWERNLAFDKLIKVEQETLHGTAIGRELAERRINALKEALILPVPDCKKLKP